MILRYESIEALIVAYKLLKSQNSDTIIWYWDRKRKVWRIYWQIEFNNAILGIRNPNSYRIGVIDDGPPRTYPNGRHYHAGMWAYV